MAVTEILGAQGQWSLQLSDETPDSVRKQLVVFGHLAVVDGEVDVADHGDALLPAARYVGILLKTDGDEDLALSGSNTLRWLGDEDGKGKVFKTPVTLANATLTDALTAVLPPAVPLGTVHPLANPALRYTNTHVFQSPREAVQVICDAFAVEYRVTNAGTLDVGRPDQLYNTTAPDTIVVRRGQGSDVDLTAIGGSYRTEESGYEFTTELLLLGAKTGANGAPDELFVTASRSAPVVPYKDLHGNPVEFIRIISESGQTEGSADVRAQLHLNRFNRLTRALAVDADQFEAGSVSGSGGAPFRVGDATYVFDPVTGVLDPAREVYFRGEPLHPDVIRITEVTWPVTAGHTVAYRTGDGEWIDLTRYVRFEGADAGSDSLGTSGVTELRVGDLPTSLTTPSGNQAVQDRVDNVGGDASKPKTPTGLHLATTPGQDSWGNQIAYLRASWDAVTQNTDNTPILDLSHYEIRFRPQFRAPGWSGSNLSDEPTVDTPVAPGLVYDVQVRAVDLAKNVSDWSGTATITAATDTAPPPSPADPLVTNYLGQLRVEYVGVDSAGFPMPSDAAAIEVYVGASADFFPFAELKVADLSPFTRGVAYATAPYGSPRWVRLVAADASGNRGPSSAAVVGTTAPATNGDISDLAVGKLTAGLMVADVILAGRFATAPFGQRTELNAVGVEAWNAALAQTVRLNGYDNLLVGRFRTGMAGVRHIDMGAIGDLSTINFVAPDAQTAFLRAFTATSTSRVDAIQMGILVPSYTSPDAFGWNSIGLTQQETAFYRTKVHDFLYQTSFAVIESSNRASGTQKTRLQIDPSAFIVRAGTPENSQVYMSYAFASGTFDLQWGDLGLIRANAGGGGASPLLAFANPAGLGHAIRSATDSQGTFMEAVNYAGNAYASWRAAAYLEISDARTKREIVDAVGSGIAGRALRVRRFKRDGSDREEIGFVAQEVRQVLPEAVIGDEVLAINPTQILAATVALLQDVDTRLTRIEGNATP